MQVAIIVAVFVQCPFDGIREVGMHITSNPRLKVLVKHEVGTRCGTVHAAKFCMAEGEQCPFRGKSAENLVMSRDVGRTALP